MLTTHSSLEHQNSIRNKTIKYYGPPGTGKTNTLVQEILTDALSQGIRPQDIAFISFTNKAVNTAVDRALVYISSIYFKRFSKIQNTS
jgi:superfamily I DNA/RNA helicase